MGLDIYFNWVAGVRLTCRKLRTVVKKFNEDTGKPYEKAAEVYRWFLDDGQIFVDLDALPTTDYELLVHNREDRDGSVCFLGINANLIGSHRYHDNESYSKFPSREVQDAAIKLATEKLHALKIPAAVGLWVYRVDSY